MTMEQVEQKKTAIRSVRVYAASLLVAVVFTFYPKTSGENSPLLTDSFEGSSRSFLDDVVDGKVEFEKANLIKQALKPDLSIAKVRTHPKKLKTVKKKILVSESRPIQISDESGPSRREESKRILGIYRVLHQQFVVATRTEILPSTQKIVKSKLVNTRKKQLKMATHKEIKESPKIVIKSGRLDIEPVTKTGGDHVQPSHSQVSNLIADESPVLSTQTFNERPQKSKDVESIKNSEAQIPASISNSSPTVAVKDDTREFNLPHEPDIVSPSRVSITPTKYSETISVPLGSGVEEAVATLDSAVSIQEDEKNSLLDNLHGGYRVFASEAFAWDTPIAEEMSSQVLSYDGTSNSNGPRWEEFSADGHTPSVSWVNQSKHSVVSLISDNTIALLERWIGGGTRMSKSMGIVFGKLPAGWRGDFLGRSEPVVILDYENERLAETEVSTSRYFAALNVEPGSGEILLREVNSERSAVIGFPVIPGKATYLDLSLVESINVRGTVYDGGNDSLSGLHSVTVKTAGQESTAVLTDKSGEFSMNGVLVFGRLPLYFESEAPNGFKHRYRFAPQKELTVSLFRFSETAIQGWVSQLSGGVNPESGIIIAALPGLAANVGVSQLMPSVQVVGTEPSLSPETYPLSLDGRLLTQRELKLELPRFVTMQVPDAFVLASIQGSTSSETVWSEMVRAQPGIINVVGTF